MRTTSGGTVQGRHRVGPAGAGGAAAKHPGRTPPPAQSGPAARGGLAAGGPAAPARHPGSTPSDEPSRTQQAPTTCPPWTPRANGRSHRFAPDSPPAQPPSPGYVQPAPPNYPQTRVITPPTPPRLYARRSNGAVPAADRASPAQPTPPAGRTPRHPGPASQPRAEQPPARQTAAATCPPPTPDRSRSRATGRRHRPLPAGPRPAVPGSRGCDLRAGRVSRPVRSRPSRGSRPRSRRGRRG